MESSPRQKTRIQRYIQNLISPNSPYHQAMATGPSKLTSPFTPLSSNITTFYLVLMVPSFGKEDPSVSLKYHLPSHFQAFSSTTNGNPSNLKKCCLTSKLLSLAKLSMVATIAPTQQSLSLANFSNPLPLVSNICTTFIHN